MWIILIVINDYIINIVKLCLDMGQLTDNKSYTQ